MVIRLLGDAEYALKPYLIAPFRNLAEMSLETAFNKKHAKARNMVERTIGIFKNRFRYLLREGELHYSLKKATKIITLHHICVFHKISLVEEIYNEESNAPYYYEEHEEFSGNEAVEIRNNILRSMLL